MKADKINISQEKLTLIEWITQLQDVSVLKKLNKVKKESRSKEDQEILDGLKEAVEELNLVLKGEKKAIDARKMLNEL